MAEQLTGAASVAVVVLAWLLLVEAMTAAIVVLATFTVLQWRSLRALMAEPPRPANRGTSPVEDQGQAARQPYRIGGGLMRWP
jgi:hypothetical protein